MRNTVNRHAATAEAEVESAVPECWLKSTDQPARTAVPRPSSQRVEELPDGPFGPEHVKGRVLPMLRNDLVFTLGL